MSVINTANLYDSIKRKFSIGTNSLDRFKADFLGAYNDVLMDLYNESLIDEPELLTDTTENSEVELRYLPQVKVGIRFFLQTQGEWVKGDDIDRYAGLAWERAKGIIANALIKDTEKDGTYTGFWEETDS